MSGAECPKRLTGRADHQAQRHRIMSQALSIGVGAVQRECDRHDEREVPEQPTLDVCRQPRRKAGATEHGLQPSQPARPHAAGLAERRLLLADQHISDRCTSRTPPTGDDNEVTAWVQHRRVQRLDRQRAPLPRVSLLENKPRGAQIGQAPAPGHQRHIVSRLQQVTGIDAADHASAENIDAHVCLHPPVGGPSGSAAVHELVPDRVRSPASPGPGSPLQDVVCRVRREGGSARARSTCRSGSTAGGHEHPGGTGRARTPG